MTQPTRTWAEVNLDALLHNLSYFRALVPVHTAVVGVVKADAYGHGAVAVAQCLRAAGVRQFAVAAVDEAVELREQGVVEEIWHLGVPLPEEAEALVAYRITPTAIDNELVDALARTVTSPEPFAVHLKLDTGMGRRGYEVAEAKALWRRAEATGRLVVSGLTTHFATADVDVEFAREQAERFAVWRRQLAADGLVAPVAHLCNSAAALQLPEAHADAIRPGIMMYGIEAGAADLQPVMAVKTRLCQVRTVPAGHDVGYAHGHRLTRETLVGLVPVGYGDGLPWALSNGAEALCGGRRVPYLGRVNMDLVQLDLNTVPAATVGDEVVLCGRQGNARITAEEIGGWAKAISYVVPTSLTRRVARYYQRGGRPLAWRAWDGQLRGAEELNP